MMIINVVTPQGEVVNQKCTGIMVSGDNGEYAILKDRVPIISTINDGYIKVTTDAKNDLYVAILHGLVEYSNNFITILAQHALAGENLEEIEKLQDEQVKALKEERRKTRVDSTKLEKELRDNIKKSRAGEL